MTKQKKRVLHESLDVQVLESQDNNIEVESATLKGHEAMQQHLC